MSRGAFNRPVVVELGRIDRKRIVVGTDDAATLLLRSWPLQDCERRQRAMRVCLDVIKGRKPASAARKAFVEAAKAARVYAGNMDIASTAVTVPSK